MHVRSATLCVSAFGRATRDGPRVEEPASRFTQATAERAGGRLFGAMSVPAIGSESMAVMYL